MIAAQLHPAAEQELSEAAQFYEVAMPGLGYAFVHDVEKVVGRICAFPKAGAPFGPSTRGAIVPNFPFRVVYRIEQERIFVLAIAHQRRRSGYWRARRSED